MESSRQEYSQGALCALEGYDAIDGLKGFTEDYGTGAYQVEINTRSSFTASSIVLRKLKNETWTDASTRLVAFDFNLFNKHTEYVTVVRLIIQQFVSGRFVPSHVIYTFKPLPHGENRAWDSAKLYLTYSLFALFLLWELYREALRMYQYRKCVGRLYEIEVSLYTVSSLSICFALASFSKWSQRRIMPSFTRARTERKLRDTFRSRGRSKDSFPIYVTHHGLCLLSHLSSIQLDLAWANIVAHISKLTQRFVRLCGCARSVLLLLQRLPRIGRTATKSRDFTPSKRLSRVLGWMLGDFDYKAFRRRILNLRL